MNTSHIVVILSSLILLCASRTSAQSTSLVAKAKKGDVGAQTDLGIEYNRQKKYIQAEYWLKKAADQGRDYAQFQLGVFYEDQHKIEKAEYWLQKAANQDYIRAQWYLGYCYKGNNGFPKDDEKSFYWYHMGANNNNKNERYQHWCQEGLGDCYRWGKGVEKNYEKAFYWYQLSSDKTSLGDCYYYGIGVPIDYYKAYKLYREGNTNDGYTPYRIGICYYYGRGIEKDYQEAVKWFQTAKGQGSGLAAQYLGDCYMYGRGVPKDLEKADEMLKYASNKGYDVSEDFKKLSEERRKQSVANNTSTNQASNIARIKRKIAEQKSNANRISPTFTLEFYEMKSDKGTFIPTNRKGEIAFIDNGSSFKLKINLNGKSNLLEIFVRRQKLSDECYNLYDVNYDTTKNYVVTCGGILHLSWDGFEVHGKVNETDISKLSKWLDNYFK